jgi:prepilin-type N-terminal cleavage/methylation domain-containing protein
MKRSGQRGFTLIELMIALLISSLLVGMILAIFSRMSLAYRGQQQVAGVQQVLAAARATIELDAKQAGLGIPQGFKTAMTGATLQSPVKISDSNVAPDKLTLFYADTSTQGVVQSGNPNAAPTVTLADPATGFTPSMLVVLTTASTAASPGHPNDPYLAQYQACVLRIAAGGVSGNVLTFENVAPWGPTASAGCTVTPAVTMVYPLVAHAYRIDTTSPARAALGALQVSYTGGLLGGAEVYTDLAYGFSDIQTAVRVLDPTGIDLDGDTDPARNWYSGAAQAGATAIPPTSPAGSTLLGISISLVAHTDRDVEGIATTQTPSLTGANPDNNSLGDRPSTVLPTTQPWPDPLLPGLRIYRYTTFQVDFRNLGVGQ